MGSFKRALLACVAAPIGFVGAAWAQQTSTVPTTIPGTHQPSPIPEPSGMTSPPAQPATGGGGATIGEIVVTAQKRSERINDVPLSITAVTGNQLAKQGITTTADLERVAPGFTYAQSQNGTPVFQIRGIGFYSEDAAAEPTVTVYTDQIPLRFARLTEGASLDVDHVEVLKGPQGTLFGQNATGGAINYVEAKPTDSFHDGYSVTYGRFNDVDATGYLSGPLTDGVDARLALHGEHRDDWQQSSTRDDTSGARRFFDARLLVDWRPNDKLKFEMNLNGWIDRSDTQQSQARGYLPVAGGPPLTPETQATFEGLTTYPYLTQNSDRLADWDPGRSYERDDRFWQSALSATYSFRPDLKLVSLTSYADADLYSPIDADGTDVRALDIDQYSSIKTLSQELRLESDTRAFKWVVGGDGGYDIADETQVTFFTGSNAQIPVSPTFALPLDGDHEINNQKIRTLSAFANAQYSITDALSVQAGARYNNESRRFAGCLADRTDTGEGLAQAFGAFIPNFQRGQCVTQLPDGSYGLYHDKLDQDNVSWRGSLNYKVNHDTLLYVNVTKGYKSGTFGTLPAITYEQLKPASQESVLAYEGGLKTSLIDRRLDVTAAAFYYDYKNKQTEGQVLAPPFGDLPYVINVPESRIYGFEGDLVAHLIHGLQTSVGFTYVDSEVTDTAITANPFNSDTINAKGEELPLTPKWQMTADAEYDFPITPDLQGFVGGDVDYRSSALSTLGALTGPAGTQDDFKIDGYALLDLRAGVQVRNYRLSVYGRNVTGVNYWNDVTHVYDTITRITGQPTTYGVTLSANW